MLTIASLFAAHTIASFQASDNLDKPRLRKRLVPFDTWWVCSDYRRRANPDQAVSYYTTDVQAALNEGYRHHTDVNRLYSHNSNAYPHRFGNYDNLVLSSDCDPDRLQELPIILDGLFDDGRDEGADRVIFDGMTGAFCGVITHRGHNDNTFHECLRHNAPIGDHPTDNLEIPTIPSLPWMDGIGAAGSGPIPKLKRAYGYNPQEESIALQVRESSAFSDLLPRDDSSSCADNTPSCNAPGCSGENNAADSTGICRDGDCAGFACNNICKDGQSCTADGCNGRSDPTGKNGVCVDGDYAGCACTPSCGDSSQDCKGCGGTSFTNGTGLCGSGDQHGCPCQSSCEAPGDCSQGDCAGLNDPSGGPGVCMGAFRGCSCNSVCGTLNDCNANGCQGYNNQTDSGDNQPGICTAGTYMGCRCNSVCPKDLKCNDGPSKCTGLNNSKGNGQCTAGDYIGCSCQSVCPTQSLQCSDSACSGQNGKCQSGDNWGCDCNGQGGTTAAPAQPSMDCTNPSPEDGDGLCTCSVGSQTIGTYTPTGGNCPTAVPDGVSLAPSPPPSPAPTSAPPPPEASFECSNPSPEDGDGLCTCSMGSKTIGTYTPTNGNCPTAAPT